MININDHIRNGVLQEVTNWAPSAAPSQNGLTDRVRVPCLVNAMAANGYLRVAHKSRLRSSLSADNNETGQPKRTDRLRIPQ